MLHHSYRPLYRVVCYEGREVEIDKCSEADGLILCYIFVFPPCDKQVCGIDTGNISVILIRRYHTVTK